MATHKSKFTETEDQEHRARLMRLQQLGIPIGSADDPSPEPDRLTVEQIQPEFARIYDLPSGAVAVVALARMTVAISGILITDREMITPWDDDYPLDLGDPETWESYRDVIDGLLPLSPTVLNDCLTNGLPLPRRQVEGVIIANGWISVPPECHDETHVTVELFLRDERRNEFCFKFGVRVDRSVKHKYERRQRDRRVGAPKRVGLYESAAGQPENQKNVLPEERQASREHDAELRRPN